MGLEMQMEKRKKHLCFERQREEALDSVVRKERTQLDKNTLSTQPFTLSLLIN
jgi:hypothetical protein